MEPTTDSTATTPVAQALDPALNGHQPEQPVIVLNKNDGEAISLREQTKQAIRALRLTRKGALRLFRQDTALCRIARSAEGVAIAQPLDEDRMRYTLERVAEFKKWAGGPTAGYRLIPTAPPLAIVRDVLAAPSWPFPALAGITRVPVVRQDGSLLTTAGYDSATELYYDPGDLAVPPIPTAPTVEQCAAALERLRDVFADFPFSGKASWPNLLALLFTLVLRHLLPPGGVPAAVIDAPRPGTGKGLLTKVITIIAGGRPANFMNLPDADEELRKLITTMLLRGATVACFDNVSRLVASDTLAMAITAPLWEDRLLGFNRNIALPMRFTWVLNGNHLQLGRDMLRRYYRVTLDRREEHPELHSGFKYADLEGHVTEHRGELLAALLTLVRGYFVAGKPQAPEPPVFGGFDAWARLMAGLLHYAGVEGFLSGRAEEAVRHDEEGQQWTAFLAAWHQDQVLGEKPVTIAQVVERVRVEGSPLREALPLTLADFIDRNGELAHRLGNALKRQVGIPRGPERLEVVKCAGGHDHVSRWRVRSANTTDSSAGAELTEAPGDGEVGGRGDGGTESSLRAVLGHAQQDDPKSKLGEIVPPVPSVPPSRISAGRQAELICPVTSGAHEYARQRTASGRRVCIHCQQPELQGDSPETLAAWGVPGFSDGGQS